MRRNFVATPHTLAVSVTLVTTLLVGACSSDLLQRDHPTHDIPPPVNRTATATSTVLADDLQLLQTLVQGTPSTQAEIVATAQRDYETAPTPSRQLRFALILATPSHPGTDLPRAQRLLRELMANPEMLMEIGRAHV